MKNNPQSKDEIIDEVRKNRSELLEKFDGDMRSFVDYLKSRKEENEKAGFKYTTRAPKYLTKKQAA